MKTSRKFLLFSLVWLGICSWTHAQNTYRELIQLIRQELDHTPHQWSGNLTLLTPDNVYHPYLVIIQKPSRDSYTLQLQYRNDEWISYQRNGSSFQMNSAQAIVQADQLMLLHLFSNIEWIWLPTAWDILIRASLFDSQEINDSTLELMISHQVFSEARLNLIIDSKNFKLQRLDWLQADQLIQSLSIESSTTAIKSEPPATIQSSGVWIPHSYQATLDNLLMADFKPLVFMTNGIETMDAGLLIDAKRLMHLIRYFSGARLFIQAVIPQEMVELENFEHPQLSIFPTIMQETKTFSAGYNHFWLTGHLDSKISSLIESRYRDKFKNKTRLEWQITPVRVGITIVLIMALLYAFLRNTRKKLLSR